MASLLFAGSYLVYDKIRSKRAEKKEKKRADYAERYARLQEDHKRQTIQYENTQRQEMPRNGFSEDPFYSSSSVIPDSSPSHRLRQASVSSSRGPTAAPTEGDVGDGPSAWVSEVLRNRERENASSTGVADHPIRGSDADKNRA